MFESFYIGAQTIRKHCWYLFNPSFPKVERMIRAFGFNRFRRPSTCKVRCSESKSTCHRQQHLGLGLGFLGGFGLIRVLGGLGWRVSAFWGIGGLGFGVGDSGFGVLGKQCLQQRSNHRSKTCDFPFLIIAVITSSINIINSVTIATIPKPLHPHTPNP